MVTLYNFAAGSFTQRNFVADVIRLNLTFIKNTKTPFIARWKAVVDFLFVIVTVSANFRRRGRRPPATVQLLVSANESDCPFVWYQDIRNASFGFVTKHACEDGQTDRRTDGRTGL